MSCSRQSGMPSVTGVTYPDHPGQAGDPLGQDRVLLVRHRWSPWPAWKASDKPHLGALAVLHLQRDRLADGRHDGQRATHSAIPSRSTTLVATSAGARPSAAATVASTDGSSEE